MVLSNYLGGTHYGIMLETSRKSRTVVLDNFSYHTFLSVVAIVINSVPLSRRRSASYGSFTSVVVETDPELLVRLQRAAIPTIRTEAQFDLFT